MSVCQPCGAVQQDSRHLWLPATWCSAVGTAVNHMGACGCCSASSDPAAMCACVTHTPVVQALVLEAEEKLEAQGAGDRASLAAAATTFYEVTIASIDQPKLLSRLSESLVRAG